MSNLSELLPTGGGQNAVDFVATGNLASGQAVVLKTDGTVEAITSGAEGLGTPVVFEAATSNYIATTYDSTNNKVVIAYQDNGNGNYGTAIVGTVSGTSISFGTPVIFESAGSYYMAIVFDSNANKVVIAYDDGGNSSYGTAIVGTVSGTSISFGSAVVFESAESGQYGIAATFDSTNNKVVIAYLDDANSFYGTAIVGTVSGTSISFGTAVVFESNTSAFPSATFDSTNGKVVIACRPTNRSFYGHAIVGTVSGTSISFGTSVAFNAGTTSGSSPTFDSTNNKIVIVYDYDAGVTGSAVVGTVSGTSISFGTPVVFSAASTSHPRVTYDSTNNKIVIAYNNAGNNGAGTYVVGTVSGTSISFGTAVVYESTAGYNSPTFDSTANKTVITYQESSGYGNAVILTVGSTNNTSFIGITSEAISSGATGAINTYGGINTVQTGLTIASDYYVQDDGSLSTTTSTVKAGQAISATTINMKDLT